MSELFYTFMDGPERSVEEQIEVIQKQISYLQNLRQKLMNPNKDQRVCCIFEEVTPRVLSIGDLIFTKYGQTGKVVEFLDDNENVDFAMEVVEDEGGRLKEGEIAKYDFSRISHIIEEDF